MTTHWTAVPLFAGLARQELVFYQPSLACLIFPSRLPLPRLFYFFEYFFFLLKYGYVYLAYTRMAASFPV